MKITSARIKEVVVDLMIGVVLALAAVGIMESL